MESARFPQPRIPSPTQSAASKGEQMLPPRTEGTSNLKGSVQDIKPSDASQPQVQSQTSEKVKINIVPDVSEATHESASVKEPAPQGSALPVEEEVQQRMVPGEAGTSPNQICLSLLFFCDEWDHVLSISLLYFPGKKKKKKKKMLLPVNGTSFFFFFSLFCL